MNLILLFPEDFTDPSHVRIAGRRFEHVLKVHGAQTGDELTVGVINDRIGTGKITHFDATVLEMKVSLDRQPPPPLPVNLILALPRPKVLKRVLRSVSSLGVKRIVFVNAYRVEKSYWSSPALAPEGIRENLVLGLEQARDTVLPEVSLKSLFKPFVEDELPSLLQGTLALAADPTAPEPCPRSTSCPLTLVIGPEGGFIPYEIGKLAAAGCTPVNCGERILSVETAVAALLSRLF